MEKEEFFKLYKQAKAKYSLLEAHGEHHPDFSNKDNFVSIYQLRGDDTVPIFTVKEENTEDTESLYKTARGRLKTWVNNQERKE